MEESMKDTLLYLAGPIDGCSFGECTDWRKCVARRLPQHIHALSPMRGKDFLAAQTMIHGEHADNPLCRQPGIVCRDRFDVMRADAVLFNFLGAKKVSIGTCIEVGWADAYRKPIIVAIEKDNVHQHMIVRGVAGFVVDNLDEAITLAIAVLSLGI
ncbi:MAG: nucleoside 2-deoxyribosyltransferase [Candidatus Falkowbacteria bacterium]